MCFSDRTPEQGPFVCVVRELDRAGEEVDRFQRLVPTARQLAGTGQPVHGSFAHARQLVGLGGPDEVGVFGLRRLGVVVGERRRMLVGAVALEPVGEHRVQTPPPRLRYRPVRDFAGEGVLHRERALPVRSTHGDCDDQIAIFEQAEVGLTAAEQVHDALPRESSAYHCSCLQGGFLGFRKTVDSRGENGMDGIRHGELRRASFEELLDELLEEERVAVGTLDEQVADVGGDRGQPLLEELVHGVAGQRIEPEDGRIASPRSPGWPLVEDLRPCRRDEHHRSPHVGDDPLEQVEEIGLGPVDVLDDENRRPARSDLGQERHCRRVQALAGIEWMELGRDVQTESEREDLASLELHENVVLGSTLPQPEVLAHDVTKRAIRDPGAVRKTPARAVDGGRILTRERVPQLADEP